jgi:hypothetical protein
MPLAGADSSEQPAVKIKQLSQARVHDNTRNSERNSRAIIERSRNDAYRLVTCRIQRHISKGECGITYSKLLANPAHI